MCNSVKLPEEFIKRMSSILGDELDDFINCFNEEPEKGIRINTLKTNINEVKKVMELTQSPFSPLSFYIHKNEKVGSMPFHCAGAFYSQEPSASSAVTVLDPQEGDVVLDLCAAPGGKSTQISALLGGKGLIWSNEVVKSRANILLSNVERMGIRNCVVSSVYPDKLATKLGGFFDKILVDAPCSGEGMFRKNIDAITEWSPEHVESCANRQQSILDSAAICLKQDGILVYSTCTFSVEENENTVKVFLENNPEFQQVEIDVNFGRKALDGKSLRIFPMDGGEGHFVAKFKRVGENNKYPDEYKFKSNKNDRSQGEDFYSTLFKNEIFGNVECINDKFIIMPKTLPDLTGINVLRAGVMLGERVGKRIEPHHGAFMAHNMKECINYINLDSDSDELEKYLRGEEISCETKGYTAVCVQGITTGFGKASNGRLKNKYPKGLRLTKTYKINF